jgi:hypothetical protein
MRQTAGQDRMGVSVGGVSGVGCSLYETDSWSGQDGRVSGWGQGPAVPCIRQTAGQDRMGVSVGGAKGRLFPV